MMANIVKLPEQQPLNPREANCQAIQTEVELSSFQIEDPSTCSLEVTTALGSCGYVPDQWLRSQASCLERQMWGLQEELQVTLVLPLRF